MDTPIIAQNETPAQAAPGPQAWVTALYEGEDIPTDWPTHLQTLATTFLTEDRNVYDAYMRKQETTDRVAWASAKFAYEVAQSNRNRAEREFRIAFFHWQEGQGR